MSEENVEIMRRSLDAFNRGDKTAWLAMSDPDAEMVPARDWPESAPIRGAEAIWDFYMEVTAAWDEGSFEFGEVIDSGADKIVANNRREALGRRSARTGEGPRERDLGGGRGTDRRPRRRARRDRPGRRWRGRRLMAAKRRIVVYNDVVRQRGRRADRGRRPLSGCLT
jgi:ketosteroid isomerase-like protein